MNFRSNLVGNVIVLLSKANNFLVYQIFHKSNKLETFLKVKSALALSLISLPSWTNWDNKGMSFVHLLTCTFKSIYRNVINAQWSWRKRDPYVSFCRLSADRKGSSHQTEGVCEGSVCEGGGLECHTIWKAKGEKWAPFYLARGNAQKSRAQQRGRFLNWDQKVWAN